MSQKISIELKNNLRELERLNRVLEEYAKLYHLPSNVLFAINLALEEIITNVISYGYRDDDEHDITIRINFNQGHLNIEVEDDGLPFNPLEAPEPDLKKPLEEREVGGLGIHLVRNLMEGLEYKRLEGKNLLIMKKKTV
jgi:anti-sigma regulatory factor (Ser/Thr protein kinase)